MTKFIQFRFYGDNKYPHTLNNINYPENLTSEDLVKGNIFLKYMPIKSLTISTLQGVKFNFDASFAPIIVGVSGVYKVDNLKKATSLNFEQDSLDFINVNPDGFLIIDIMYEED